MLTEILFRNIIHYLVLLCSVSLPPPSWLNWISAGLPSERSRVSTPARRRGWATTQGLRITEENVLPLLGHLQMVRHSSLLG